MSSATTAGDGGLDFPCSVEPSGATTGGGQWREGAAIVAPLLLQASIVGPRYERQLTGHLLPTKLDSAAK